MGDQYAFKTELEPIFFPGEHAHIITAQAQLDVVCVAVGALPEYTKDFGALTASTWNVDNEADSLEMNEWEIGHFRMRVLDDLRLRFNNLGPTRQWRTSREDFYLTQFPHDQGETFLQEFMFKASEFFVWQDDTPRFDLYPELGSLPTSRVKFSGWRYKVRKVTVQKGAIKKIIWISGWPSGAAA